MRLFKREWERMRNTVGAEGVRDAGRVVKSMSDREWNRLPSERVSVGERDSGCVGENVSVAQCE